MIKTLQTRWSGLWGNLEDLVDTGTEWARSVLPWEGWQTGRVQYEEGFGAKAQTSSSRFRDMGTDGTAKELDVMETGTVTAWDAVDILWEMGALIVLSGGAKSRRSGLRKAADFIEENHERWGDISVEELQELEWAEEAIETFLQLQQQDVPTLLGELRSELGKNAADLLRVRGIGFDKATTIHEELDIWTLEDLEDAARTGVLLQVKGIGPKSLEKLKGNIKAALEEKKARLQRRAAAKKQVAVKTETTPQARLVEKPVEAASSTTHPSSNEPRDLLDLLRCPTTHQSGFEMSGAEAVLPATGRRYLVTQGVLDMVGEGHVPPSWAQTVMENRLYTRFYESVFRPNLTRIVTRRSVKDDIALSLEMLELQPHWSVLDVACGPGNYTRAIAQALEPERGVAVGVDVSWPMLRKAVIQKARKRISNLHFVRGSALHLPFQNDSFDAVHCTAALHLFSDPSRALHEFHRVIRPNGHLVIGTFLQSRFLPLRLAQRMGSPLTGFHWFSLEELEDVVMDAGFTVARTEINGLAISLSAVAHND